MSEATMRNSVWASRIFIEGFHDIVKEALRINAGDLTAPERVLLSELATLLFNCAIRGTNFSNNPYVYKSQFLNKLNQMIKDLGNSDVLLGAMVKAYNMVLAKVKNLILDGTDMPGVQVNIVGAYLDWSQNLPEEGFLTIMQQFWDYVNPNAHPTQSKFVEPELVPRNDIDINRDNMRSWMPHAKFASIVATLLSRYYNFNATFTAGNDQYKIDTAPLIGKYQGGTGTVTLDQRRGLQYVMLALKQPRWVASQTQLDFITKACTGTNALTKVNSLLDCHRISFANAKIENYMPFRAGFDVNNMNGDSVWQFREGDSTNSVYDDIYSVRVGDAWAYPARSLVLNKDDSCKFTNIDSVCMVDIQKDGKRQPDLYFRSNKIY
jgi:hypothetical protein